MLNVIENDVELTRKGFITNYPDYRHWRKEAIDDGATPKPLNIYLHLPYCIQRCAYCHYKTTTLRSTHLTDIDKYVESLCREIEICAERFHLRERPAISIYFGGGTPTLMSARTIDRIMLTLGRHLTPSAPEITFEAEPVSLTKSKAELLVQHGVNRINVGIQSFCDDIVFRTGRRDTEQQALKAIDIALSTGAVVNVDLISGLEGESRETWAYSVRRAVESGAHSITVYKLEVYANTEYFASLRRQKISLPSDEDELTFARYALDALTCAGYQPANFFTFTREGRYVQRHVTTKWQGVDVYAFGTSAFGSFGNLAYQNTNDLERYSEILRDGKLPWFRGHVYNDLELMTRDVVLGMKLVRFDRRQFRERHGIDVVRLCQTSFERLESDGFITVTDDAITLSDKGVVYGDYVGRSLATELEALAA